MPLPNLPTDERAIDAKMIRTPMKTSRGSGREINEWFASVKVNMFLQTEADRPSPWLVVHTNDYLPPIRFIVRIGECLHNMQSDADNLVRGLARTVVTRKCAGLAFPLLADQEEWGRRPSRPLS